MEWAIFFGGENGVPEMGLEGFGPNFQILLRPKRGFLAFEFEGPRGFQQWLV